MSEDVIATAEEVAAVKEEVSSEKPGLKVTTVMLLEVVSVEEGEKKTTYLVKHDPETKERTVYHNVHLHADGFWYRDPSGEAKPVFTGQVLMLKARRDQ